LGPRVSREGSDILTGVFADWSSSDTIAAIASIAGLLQVAALIFTIFVMIRNGRRQLRAYVFVENAWAKRVADKDEWTIKYRVKNTGATPAYKARVTDIAKAVDWTISALPKPIQTEYFGTMAPNGDFIEQDSDTVTGVTNEELRNVTKTILLVGRIDYLDAFKCKRWTEFCFCTSDEDPSDGEMSVYDRGNEAN
jgi:hypothetical protein